MARRYRKGEPVRFVHPINRGRFNKRGKSKVRVGTRGQVRAERRARWGRHVYDVEIPKSLFKGAKTVKYVPQKALKRHHSLGWQFWLVAVIILATACILMAH